ncbi:hypothetical protein [Bacteroides ilei]|uniref:hypothetical protein n=1 Tax=Bacteroides ilei TaxID=1907658 RepID=UPI003AB295C5
MLNISKYMINIHSIYKLLFLPLLIILMLGITGCSNDSVEEENTDSLPKSRIVLTVRGVTTSPTEGNYDEYIETLRIIGFDKNQSVVCNSLYGGTELTLTASGDAIVITEKLEEAFQGGTCDFYFIANEKAYTSYETSQPLSEFLSAESLTEDALEDCVIAYAGEEPGETNQRPILMTASVNSALKPGDNTIDDIELVRCFAKFQLKVKNTSSDVITVSNAIIKGQYPTSFWLLNGGNYMTDQSKGFTTDLQTDAITVSSGVTAEIGELYFPEWLSQTDVGVNYSFTLRDGISNETYEFSAVDDNITRNTCYVTTATFAGWESVSIRLEVAPWDVVSSEIHWNTTPAFNLNVNKEAVNSDNKKYYPIIYTATNDPHDTNDLVFTFSITEPLGSAWAFSLSNGSDFYFVDPADADNYKYVPNGIVGTDSQNLTIRLRAKNPYNADIPQETLLAVKYQMADRTWNRLIIDAEQTTNESRDVYLIRQIPAN